MIDFPVMSSEVSSGPSADRTDRIDTDWKLLRVALFSVLSAQYYQLIITEDTPRDKKEVMSLKKREDDSYEEIHHQPG